MLLRLFTLFCLLVPSLAGFYDKNDAIIQLTPSNFDTEVFGSEHAWIIEFYAPWCGHCQRLVPEYEKAAENLKGLVRVGSVNCDEDANKALCGRYQIQGFPTLKLFPGVSKPKASSKRFTKEPKDYQGARTARAMVEAALAEMANLSVRLGKQKRVEDFLGSNPEIPPKALLFTTKATTAPLFKALSVDFSGRLLLAEIPDSHKEAITRFGVQQFPSLLVFPDASNPDVHVVYDGPLQHAKLSEFLEKYALPPIKKAGSPKKEEKKPEPPVEPVFNPEIVELKSQKDLAAECLDRATGMCLVSFMVVEPEFEESVKEHAEQLRILKAIKKAAFDKKLPFNVLWLNALTEKKLLDAFNLSDQFPSLVVISPSKKVYRPFTGGFDEQSIQDFLDETSKARGRYFKFDFTPTMSVAE